MKKTISVILAAAMTAALAACGPSAPAQSTTAAPAATQAAAPAATQAAAQEAPAAAEVKWPAETVNVYLPAAAGSQIDLVCRLETKWLTEKTGQNFVVINDETGNGSVAYETVRNAKPNGNTLLYTQNIWIQYYGDVYNTYPADAVDVVSMGGDPAVASYGIACAKGLPYTTWEELVAYAKENPGKVTCGIQNGGMAHLMSAIMAKQAGIEVKMVESGGSQEKITNMLGGRVDFAMLAAKTMLPYIESNDLVALAQCSMERSETYPDWPTTAELGYPDVQNLTKSAWYVPKNMDPELKKAINEAMKEMENDKELQEALFSMGSTFKYYTIEESEKQLLDAAASLKDGYALTGKDMANYK